MPRDDPHKPTVPPTIKDVARRAGVHFSTVSQALRGHPRVSALTRAVVLQAAEDLGYRPTAVTRALARFRSSSDTPEQCRMLFVHSAASAVDPSLRRLETRLALGAAHQAQALGFTLESVEEGSADSGDPSAHTPGQSMRAFILPTFSLRGGSVSRASPRNQGCAIAVGPQVLPGCPRFVAPDEEESLRACLTHLRELGYRRIGLVMTEADPEESRWRSSAVLCIDQRAVPNGPPIPPLSLGDESPGGSHARILQRWAVDHRVDAVVARRWRPPTGPDWATMRAAFASFLITEPDETPAGVHFDLEDMGARAAALLASRLYLDDTEAANHSVGVFLPGTWRGGASAPPRAHAFRSAP